MYNKGHQRVAVIPDTSSLPHQKETPTIATPPDQENTATTKRLSLLQAPVLKPKQHHASWLWYLLGLTDSLFTPFQL